MAASKLARIRLSRSRALPGIRSMPMAALIANGSRESGRINAGKRSMSETVAACRLAEAVEEAAGAGLVERRRVDRGCRSVVAVPVHRGRDVRVKPRSGDPKRRSAT
jgi:hypothetical protein